MKSIRRALLSTFFIVFAMWLLTACEPNEMNQAEADAVKACIEKGWVPVYNISGSHRNFNCTPHEAD